MLDALIPAVRAFAETEDVELMARKADDGAAGTAMVTTTDSGRSSYLKEEALAGVEDPGARAIAIIIRAISGSIA